MNGAALSSIKKLINRFKRIPADFKYSDLVTLMEHFGYTEDTGGKTSGSRIRFIHNDLAPVAIHKPHPGNEMKKYMIRDIIRIMKERGQLQ